MLEVSNNKVYFSDPTVPSFRGLQSDSGDKGEVIVLQGLCDHTACGWW